LRRRGVSSIATPPAPAEAARADRVITIDSGRILSDTHADPNPSFTDEAAASPTQRHTSPETPRDTSQLEGGIDRESAADDATPAMASFVALEHTIARATLTVTHQA